MTPGAGAVDPLVALDDASAAVALADNAPLPQLDDMLMKLSPELNAAMSELLRAEFREVQFWQENTEGQR